MGTFQEPNPDREWLKRSYEDTSGNPFTVEAQVQGIGRLAEGTGDSRMARVGRIVIKATVWIMIGAGALAVLAEILNQPH